MPFSSPAAAAAAATVFNLTEIRLRLPAAGAAAAAEHLNRAQVVRLLIPLDTAVGRNSLQSHLMTLGDVQQGLPYLYPPSAPRVETCQAPVCLSPIVDEHKEVSKNGNAEYVTPSKHLVPMKI